MINKIPPDAVRNLLTIVSQSNKSLPIKPGTTIRALVSAVNNDGEAVLRIISSGGSKKNIQGTLINVRSQAPLSKGQTVLLEVISGRSETTGKPEVIMKLIGDGTGLTGAVQQKIPIKMLNMLAGLSDSRLTSSELQSLLTALRAIPDNIKTSIPEFSSLEAMLPGLNQIDGKVLKAFIESTGIALETKMKIAVLSDPGSILQNLVALQAGADLKSLMLKIKKLLAKHNMISSLRQAGLKPEEISRAADKIIRHIEFFQFSARVNDMFCTFLPVLWEGFNDGEFLFRKGRHDKKPSCTCDVNLDLHTLGRLSISITTVNRDFYITFHVDSRKTQKLIHSEKAKLKERFASLGMPLKALSITHRKEISFGTMQQKEISMKA